jgi:hypothetical protein
MGERATYFHYREGITPDLLQLGSMVYDFRNPKTRRPFRNTPPQYVMRTPRVG